MKYNIKIRVPPEINGSSAGEYSYEEQTDDLADSILRIEFNIASTIEKLQIAESPEFFKQTGFNRPVIRQKVKELTVILKSLLYIKEILSRKIIELTQHTKT